MVGSVLRKACQSAILPAKASNASAGVIATDDVLEHVVCDNIEDLRIGEIHKFEAKRMDSINIPHGLDKLQLESETFRQILQTPGRCEL